MLRPSVVAIYLATVAIVVSAAAVGQAALCLCGRRDWAWWSPAVGLAVLLAVGGILVHLPGRVTTAAVAMAALTVASLALAAVRRALRAAVPVGLPLAVVTVFFASLPHLVTGRDGIAGAVGSDDMSAHLTTAWWLGTHAGFEPVSASRDSLFANGYPLGPHAVAAVVAQGLHVSLVHAFDALLLAITPILALTAMAAMPARPRAVAAVGAAVVALSYLTISYPVSGGFKEPIEGLLLVALAVAVRDIARSRPRPSVRDGIPLGLLLAGTIYAYSVSGLIWPVAAGAALLVLERVLSRVPLRVALAAARRPATGAVVALAVAAVAEVPRMVDFAGSSFAGEHGSGNLPHYPVPLEALGIWLVGDFRLTPHPLSLSLALGAVALAALVFGLVWWVRRRDLVVPATFAGALLVYVALTAARGVYASAKGLVVLAPVAMLTLVPALVAAWGPRPGRLPHRLPRALGAVLLAGAAASSFLVLRDGLVGPADHGRDLDRLRPLVQDRSVLFAGIDDFAQWHLRGARRLALGPFLYAPERVPTGPPKRWHGGEPLDFDSFTSRTLDAFDDVVLPRSGYASQAPSNFRLVASTPSYDLWRRTGRTPARTPMERNGAPGATFRCTTPAGRALAAGGGVASVLPTPVVGDQAGWRGQPIRAGQSARQTLTVPAGTWDLWLQYAGVTGLDVRAGDLRARLAPSADRIGPFWAVGTLHRPRSGPLTVEVRARPATALGRLLGASARTRALNSPGQLPLSGVALTRAGARERLVPLRGACGHYVDFYARPTAATRTRSSA
jgi:hypothetical protein